LSWEDHDIKGKGSYYGPWKRIVKFANDIHQALKTRFPPEQFLQALDIIDPETWKTALDRESGSSILLYSLLMEQISN
jgi:hypothetical protein